MEGILLMESYLVAILASPPTIPGLLKDHNLNVFTIVYVSTTRKGNFHISLNCNTAEMAFFEIQEALHGKLILTRISMQLKV